MKIKTNIKKRGMLALALVILVGVLLVIRVGYIQFVKGEYYSSKAESQQLSDSEVSANRGKIYDSNMNILAQSASVYKVYLNPSKILELAEDKQDKAREIIASGLSVILGVDEEKILSYTQKTSISYQLVKSGVENDMKEEVQEFIKKYAKSNNNASDGEEDSSIDLSEIVCIDPDVKRYYPYSSLASTVIGFTGSDGVGRYGLEYYYDDVLKGVSGRTITAVKGNGSKMPNQYETIYEAQEGNSLVLTIDMYIQYILEDVLSEALEETQAENVYGIVMDVDTGAILAMASLPDFDLNNPYEIKSDELLATYIEKASAPEEESESEEEKEKRNKSYYQNLQWSNRTVTTTYDPGSVFKVITASAAIEEGVATLDTSFYCSGVMYYAPAARDVHCWYTGGHGSETFVDLLKNSCNPFAVTVADALGKDVFYDYFEAFGFTEKTGIDTVGEGVLTTGNNYVARDSFTYSNLRSYSFGQTFQATPLQIITAISAVANGGNLMTPYLVSKQIDAEGNTVSETTPTVRRQVISESTAKIISECMEEVVSSGTGSPAYVAGYRVAGKTGTTEKLETMTDSGKTEYVASFCGFAPADDPEIAVLIVVDEPQGTHGGSSVAAPRAGEVFEQVLEYLGVERSYTDEEMSLLVETAPLLTGKSISEARATVADKDLTIKVIGDGDSVVAQYPDAGRDIPSDGIIVVYTQSDNTSETVTVPDFTGCTVSQANKLAINSGLNIKISGSSLSSGTVYAYKQSVAAGESVNMGEIITVSFMTNVDVAD